MAIVAIWINSTQNLEARHTSKSLPLSIDQRIRTCQTLRNRTVVDRNWANGSEDQGKTDRSSRGPDGCLGGVG
jgi:hypothetical protein